MQYPAGEQPRCNAWNKRCKGCNYRFSKDEPHSADYPCPICGELRTQCRRFVKRAGEKCSRNHGGGSPRGPASPHWKHGKYSKHINTALAERYEEARSNTELMSLRDDIAMMDTRIGQLFDELAGMQTDESISTWERAKQTYKRMKQAIEKQDGATVLAAMDILDTVFEEGRSPVRIWDEIIDLMAKKSRLMEMESRIATRERLVISVEEFNILLARTIGVIKTYVSDRETLTAIARGFSEYMVAGTRGGAGLGSGVGEVVEAIARPSD